MSFRGPERRGQSLVEFALILWILVVVLLGILDFGRAIAAYNSISNAANRHASSDRGPDRCEH